MVESPAEVVIGKEQRFAVLISGLAIGLVGIFAAGSTIEYSSLAVVALSLLVVGPVAVRGLQFSIKQVSVFMAGETPLPAAQKAPEAEAATKPALQPKGSASAASSVAANPAVASTSESQKPSAGIESDHVPSKEPSAWDLLAETWDALPSASKLSQNLQGGLRRLPGACMRFPRSCADLWQWLRRPCWRPFPWNHLPDSTAFVWGILELLFIAPIAAVEIAVSVPTMELLKAEWCQPRCAWLRAALPELVRSISRPLGRLTLRDPRNHSYLPWMFILGVCVPTAFFWALRRYMTHGLEISTLCIYHLVRVGPRFQLFAHAHALVHKEGHAHRGFFKGVFKCMNCFTEWWIGPFYGVVPWNYYVAHMKIHHRWHNDVDDVHTNLDLDRTDPRSFLLYVPRFTLYWTGLSPLALFIKREEWALVAKLLYGMVAYYGLTLAMFCWDPVFCTVYWLFPHVEACVLLCAISYLWHAFVEEEDPGNQYVNSVTILDGHDNVWNEDYHVVHHHCPNTHWTDAPAHFEAHRERYASVTATIFRDTEEGKLLQWLFEQNWDMMAKHFVDLNGKLSFEEKKALIIRRLSVLVGSSGRDGKRVEWGATSTIRDFQE